MKPLTNTEELVLRTVITHAANGQSLSAGAIAEECEVHRNTLRRTLKGICANLGVPESGDPVTVALMAVLHGAIPVRSDLQAAFRFVQWCSGAAPHPAIDSWLNDMMAAWTKRQEESAA